MDKTDFEFHFPGKNYCGPGTDLGKRLEKDGKTPKAKYKPTDRIDEISLRHDIFYQTHHRGRDRIKGDDIMLRELRELKNLTCKERFQRAIIASLLFIKRSICACWYAIVDIKV
jgi:hypothetical protein